MKVIFYSVCEIGSIDVLECINGHDKGNYHYSDMDAVEMTYPKTEWLYVEVE